MIKTRRRRCLCCQKLFGHDPRARHRQKYCSEPECRVASKRSSQRRWLRKPENHEYFCGEQHVVARTEPRLSQKRREFHGMTTRDELIARSIPLLIEPDTLSVTHWRELTPGSATAVLPARRSRTTSRRRTRLRIPSGPRGETSRCSRQRQDGRRPQLGSLRQ
jgi:hypothetical protein